MHCYKFYVFANAKLYPKGIQFKFFKEMYGKDNNITVNSNNHNIF